MLPMIDIKPTDSSCIYSTLCFVVDQAKQLSLPTPVVTFYQPLWIKAVEIAKAAHLDIVCRLGGFHIMKIFLGAIGTVMAGSGIEELLGQIYGSNTVVHMMHGDAVSRAVRGHFMLQGALVVRLLKTTVFNADSTMPQHSLLDNVRQLIDTVDANKVDVGDCSMLVSELVSTIEAQLNAIMDTLSVQSRTAKLWIRYFRYVAILKHFLLAERTCNWQLHLKCVHDMLNLFAATGRNSYCKSCRLYLQIMVDLPNTHPGLYDMFAVRGLHSVRRTDGRYWGGLSLDLIIEQCLMKCIKGQGGLTRGRGMSDSVRSLWVSTMPQCAAVHLPVIMATCR